MLEKLHPQVMQAAPEALGAHRTLSASWTRHHPGHQTNIRVSTDLLAWAPWTNATITNLTVEVLDSMLERPERLYRAASPPPP